MQGQKSEKDRYVIAKIVPGKNAGTKILLGKKMQGPKSFLKEDGADLWCIKIVLLFLLLITWT
jgi:hypothetical protein